MAALQPPNQPSRSGGLAPPKSFAVAVALASISATDPCADVGIVSSFRGESALQMSHEDMLGLAKPFHNALVG